MRTAKATAAMSAALRKLLSEVSEQAAGQAIVGAIVHVCQALNITVIAEGIETQAEAKTLRELGIHLMQGFLFARPGFESLPTPSF